MKEFQLELCRVFRDEKQTLGQLDVINTTVHSNETCVRFTCYSLELPWLDNEKRISCIIDGVYKVTKENHKKFGWCFRLHDVPNRDGVLIHAGTTFEHTLGCILPASEQEDITKDGILDNTGSRKALAKLCEYNITSINIWTRP